MLLCPWYTLKEVINMAKETLDEQIEKIEEALEFCQLVGLLEDEE